MQYIPHPTSHSPLALCTPDRPLPSRPPCSHDLSVLLPLGALRDVLPGLKTSLHLMRGGVCVLQGVRAWPAVGGSQTLPQLTTRSQIFAEPLPCQEVCPKPREPDLQKAPARGAGRLAVAAAFVEAAVVTSSRLLSPPVLTPAASRAPHGTGPSPRHWHPLSCVLGTLDPLVRDHQPGGGVKFKPSPA